MWGIFGKPLKRAIWNTLGLHVVLTTCLRSLSDLDGACVACCVFLSTGRYHVCIQIHAACCCFARCTTNTTNPENLEAHPGFVWVKSGYSEAIPWRKVQLTKQRNVDLTTDGLLQDWEKLKKYVPNHKHGDVCPNGVPALAERGNDDNESDSE